MSGSYQRKFSYSGLRGNCTRDFGTVKRDKTGSGEEGVRTGREAQFASSCGEGLTC